MARLQESIAVMKFHKFITIVIMSIPLFSISCTYVYTDYVTKLDLNKISETTKLSKVIKIRSFIVKNKYDKELANIDNIANVGVFGSKFYIVKTSEILKNDLHDIIEQTCTIDDNSSTDLVITITNIVVNTRQNPAIGVPVVGLLAIGSDFVFTLTTNIKIEVEENDVVSKVYISEESSDSKSTALTSEQISQAFSKMIDAHRYKYYPVLIDDFFKRYL